MRQSSEIGSLAVVGSGIRALHQMTVEARRWIEHSDKVFYAVCDPFTTEWIKKTCPDAEDLCSCYAEGKDRWQSYGEMIERILNQVRLGSRVCAIFYGHPGVFVYPSHEVIRLAQQEGRKAFMIPGISTEDCLYADLGVDPGASGCLSYEATEFLVGDHSLEPTCAVILWQVDCVGDPTYHAEGYDGRHIPRLVEKLLRFYPSEHTAYLYSAPLLFAGRPGVHPVQLQSLDEALATHKGFGTLYVPPTGPPSMDFTMAMKLGMEMSDLVGQSEGEKTING